MRILVTGASGLVGHAVMAEGKELGHEMVGTYLTRRPTDDFRYLCMDLLDKTQIDTVFRDVLPEAVVHCAAMANVDKCEQYPNLSYAANVTGTRWVKEAADALRARLCFISTGYVFAGTLTEYCEQATRAPVNTYGTHKLQAEIACEDALVVRTCGVFGAELCSIKCAPARWVKALRSGKILEVPDAYYQSWTSADELALAIIQLVEQDATGPVHLAGPYAGTKVDMARLVASLVGGKVVAVPATGKVPRPFYCALVSHRYPLGRDVVKELERYFVE